MNTAADRAFAEAREQGLPEQIQDPSVLAAVAALIGASTAKEHDRSEAA